MIPIPVYFPSGNSAPMTEHEAKVFFGVALILTVLWIISTAIAVIKYFRTGWYDTFADFWDDYFFHDNFIIAVFRLIMVVCYGVALLIYLGSLVAKLF